MSQDWMGETPSVENSDIVETKSTDLLIIGGGHSGMIAALQAHDLGENYIVCEKGGAPGIAKKYLGLVNTRLTAELDSKVDEGKLLNEVTRYASGKCNQKLIKMWINESSDFFDWMEGLGFIGGCDRGDYYADGHPSGGTDYYVPLLEEHYLAPPIPDDMPGSSIRNEYIYDSVLDQSKVLLNTNLVQLIRENDNSGRVTGAIFETKDGYMHIHLPQKP